jgi:hypothetical protein
MLPFFIYFNRHPNFFFKGDVFNVSLHLPVFGSLAGFPYQTVSVIPAAMHEKRNKDTDNFLSR